MKALPTRQENYVRCFIDSLGVRGRDAARVYRHTVRHLLRFVRQMHGKEDFSRSMLVAWMKERSRRCSLDRVEEHAQMANRFLAWMKLNRHLSSNAFDELRCEYGGRLAPIVRALLSQNPNVALEQLRPLPLFASTLGPLMREHMDMMRSLGYRYESADGQLRRFDRFLQSRPDLIGKRLPELIEAWRQIHPGLHHALEAQHCARMLSKAQARHDPTTAVLSGDPRLWRQMRASHRRPHIYSEQDIVKLLETARQLPSRVYPLRPWSAYTMLSITYCAGLRIQEVTNLNLGDVDLSNGSIDIRNSKFFKSRRLPLPAGVLNVLRDYIDRRRKAGASTDPEAGLFWNTLRRKRYEKKAAQELLVTVLRRAGIKTGRGKTGPRVHDLRHAMVCNRMLDWYQTGVNPQSHLAHLSTFMGHKDIQSTLAYMTITPELLQLASERFRRHGGHVVKNTECLS